ncbi:HEAT repeat domain-containing protein [Synechocystis sp. LKSZ1]|uniref:HEAT repeat domain-containing protein n=1 Tax=Synechocystis sp. LKSZ1 TaxID=3144951 RepID=UPI00336BE7DC
MVSETGQLQQPEAQIDWSAVCQSMLERFLPRNSVNTQPHSKQVLSKVVPKTLRITPVLRRTSAQAASPKYGPQAFLHHLIAQGLAKSKGKRLAILGEAGTGKTLFLQYFAHCLLQESEGQSLPIWISPAQLKQLSLRDYLMGPWLEQAAQGHVLSLPLWRLSFTEQLQSGRLWILADGFDYSYADLDTPTHQGPLSSLMSSLQDWFRLHLVLTCRPETRQSDPKGLVGFERYQTSPLAYPEEVELAIEDCLAPQERDSPAPPEHQDLAQSLRQVLAQGQREHLRQCLTSPIRLLLCCRFWQTRPPVFPANRTALYRELSEAFYQWKAELVSTNGEQRQSLAQAFGELGKRVLLEDRPKDQSLSQADMEAVFGKNSPLLRLALQLGWLIPRGLVREGAWERGYGFFDRSFRDYFTALVIDNWQFFLEPATQSYRLFDPQWQAVMHFWMGRTDVAAQAKNDFLETLLVFDDHCSPENFYGKRAFLLAASLLQDYPDFPQADAILEQLWQASQGQTDSPLQWQKLTADCLPNTDRSHLIALLLKRLTLPEAGANGIAPICSYLAQWGPGDEAAMTTLQAQLRQVDQKTQRFNLAETLGQIHPGDELALQTLIQELQDPNHDGYYLALQALGKIAKGNRSAIAAVLEALSLDLSPVQHRQLLVCLEHIARHDDLAIASLTQRLRTYPEGPFRCQVAESLEKIDPGNPTALSLLRRLLLPQESLDTRKQGIYSLGEIALPSAAVINDLAALLQDSDIFLRWLAMSSLAKIGNGHPTAIAALENLLRDILDQPTSEESEWLLKEGVDALAKIDPGNPLLLHTLVHLLENPLDPQTHQDSAEILGQLDPGNPSAINVLLKLLRKNSDEFIQRQAATNLGLIDPGNLTAMMALINLLNQSSNQDIKRLAAQSLGQIGQQNPAVIAALVRSVERQPERETLRAIIQSLTKVGQGNREVAHLLLNLLRRQTDPSLRLEIAESLTTILPQKMLTFVVTQLRDWCTQGSDHRQPADWELLWHCAQALPYTTFYQAWHHHALEEANAPSLSPDHFWVGQASLTVEHGYQKVAKHPGQAVALWALTVPQATELSASPAWELETLANLARQLRQQWPTLQSIVIHHRFGPMTAGDISLVVAIGAPDFSLAWEALRDIRTALQP